MAIRKKTVLNILLIAFVLSFFVTPLGYHGKILLNRLFAGRSKGKVVFINFWASWRLPSAAELKSVQNLHELFKDQVDFYIITDEEQDPVREFMEENDLYFPVTYLVIGDRAPLPILEPPGTYILDKEGKIAVKKEGIADWDNKDVQQLLENLLK